MNASDYEITHKALESFEEENLSRKLTGFNVFIAHYVRQFRDLDDVVKSHLLNGSTTSSIPNSIIGECIYDSDGTDFDSTDSLHIEYCSIFSHPCAYWRDLRMDIKE